MIDVTVFDVTVFDVTVFDVTVFDVTVFEQCGAVRQLTDEGGGNRRSRDQAIGHRVGAPGAVLWGMRGRNQLHAFSQWYVPSARQQATRSRVGSCLTETVGLASLAISRAKKERVVAGSHGRIIAQCGAGSICRTVGDPGAAPLSDFSGDHTSGFPIR